MRGPGDQEAVDERARLGREYLARRNQEMQELQRKRGVSSPASEEAPSSPTSFDALVDKEGRLRLGDKALPDVPVALSSPAESEMKQPTEPVPISESSTSAATSGWQIGAAMANPFGDEFEMERSITPKPPVPPKIKLEEEPERTQASVQQQPDPQARNEELSYEEQLAIALSLSESESSKPSATVRQGAQENPDADLRAAIEASLRDMDGQQAAHAVAHAAPVTPRMPVSQEQPLVDLTPDPPISTPQELPRGDWRSLFDHSVWTEDQKAADPPVSAPAQALDTEEEDLYTATPQLTRARLAVHDSVQGSSNTSGATKPYDPVHEAASALRQQPPPPMDASFYSAQSHSTPPASQTLASDSSPQVVDVSDAPSRSAADLTPTNRSRASSFTFSNASGSDAFASLPAVSRDQTPPRPSSSAQRSEMSEIEVIDVLEDSDVDMLSEEGDGIATPDSWTEVGSQDGESEIGQGEAHPQTS